MTDANAVALEEPPFKEILTKRLRLRTLRVADAQILLDIGLITRFDVMKWTSHGPVSNLEQARKWLHTRSMGKDVFNFIIELKQPSPEVIGLAGSFHPPEIGYMIHPSHAGQGYATEAITAIIEAMWTRFPSPSSTHIPLQEGETGFDYVEGCINVNNAASKRILEKCGFTYVGKEADSENPRLGDTEMLFFRKARPGKTLEGLGLDRLESSGPEEDRVVPPVE